jgi:uncharacterized protein (DUF58 family)
MIVPQTRLLLWFGAVVLPCAAAAAIVPSAPMAPLALAGALLVALVALIDLVRAHGVLDGIGVELPDVVRLTKDREGQIEVKVRNERQKAMRVRFGLAFPREVRSPNEDRTAVLPSGSQHSRFLWPCTAIQRGAYVLQNCYLETNSPLGFWAVHAVAPARSELRVYPNLGHERKNLAALFLNRGSFGVHTQRQIGKGREFEKLREYIPGDSSEDIHWKATAKRGRPVTKVFQIERTQEVYVIIDASRLSARNLNNAEFTDPNLEPNTLNPGLPPSMLEGFITAALVLGIAAERQGDLFGLVTFSNKVHKFIRARNGKQHYGTCRDALFGLQPQIVNPDFDDLCAFLRLRLRRRALLVFLTNLDDPILAESFVHNMDLISGQHLVLVNMLRPRNVAPVFADAQVTTVDDIYQRLGGHLLWHNLRELEKTLQHRSVQFAQLDNEKMSAQLVSQYLAVKRRQLL